MNRFLMWLLAVTLILTGCAQQQIHPLPPKDRETVNLVDAVDGDTAKVEIDGKVETVRFFLVDTPETSHPRLGEQPLGKEAKEMTAKLLESAEQVELEYDVGNGINTTGCWRTWGNTSEAVTRGKVYPDKYQQSYLFTGHRMVS